MNKYYKGISNQLEGGRTGHLTTDNLNTKLKVINIKDKIFELVAEKLPCTYLYCASEDMYLFLSLSHPNDCRYLAHHFRPIILVDYNQYWAKLNE